MDDLVPTMEEQNAEAEAWLVTNYPCRADYNGYNMLHAYLAGKAAGLAQAKAMVDAAREGKMPC